MQHPFHTTFFDWQPLSQGFLIANYSKTNVSYEKTISQ